MELGRTGEVRRGGRIVSTGMAVSKKSAVSGPLPPAQAKADRLALSRQVVNYLEERNRQIMEASRKREEESSPEKRQLDLMEKALKTMDKCQKIFARVSAGDKVPPEDLRYLEKNDPEGYKLALALRTPKKHPKEWKSVLDDEDRERPADETGESSGAGESPQPEAVAAGSESAQV